MIIEAMFPHNVGAIVQCLTDNKARVLQDVRLVIGRNGGNVAPTNFLFQRKGRIIFRKQDTTGADDVLEKAIDTGATDVDVDEEGRLIVDTEPAALTAVAQSLVESFALQLESSQMTYDPIEETLVKLGARQAEEINDLLQMIEEEPAVQDTYTNIALDHT